MANRTLVDGRAAEVVPVTDRGLQYGDGLFETIAVFAGVPCLWNAHMARLKDGCHRLGIQPPDEALLWEEAAKLTRDTDQAVLKIIITRGEGGRGYRPPAVAVPRRILSCHDWPDYPVEFGLTGVRIRWCQTRLGSNPQLAGIKHCNRLEQVLARAEWDDPSLPEGLMCDAHGRVIEGTMTNVFLLKNNRLLTPVLDQCGVAGIGRALLMDIAGEFDMPCDEGRVAHTELLAADAVLLTNALIGVWAVTEIDDHVFDPANRPAALLARVMERVYQP